MFHVPGWRPIRYDRVMDNGTDGERRLPMALRLGTACALVGIVIGAILAWSNLDKFVELFRLGVPRYGHFMLPSFVLGGVAIAAAISEIMRSGRYVAPLGVFALGAASIATPLFLGIALAAVTAVVVITAIIGAISGG